MNPDKKPNNPSAFPSKTIDHHESAMQSRTVYNGQEEGMTLRDYFAAKAMQAFTTRYGTCLINYNDRAKQSYKLADAMLKQREI